MDSSLLPAGIVIQGNAVISGTDRRWRCDVYDWCFLLWKAAKQILSFHMAYMHQSGKHSAFHCHCIRYVTKSASLLDTEKRFFYVVTQFAGRPVLASLSVCQRL